MKIAEFFAEMAFKGDRRPVDGMNESLEGLQKTIDSLKVVALAVAIERFISSTINATAQLVNFNQQTGISIERLQAFQSAANMANVALSFEQVASSINSVEQNLAQIRMGGGNVAPFQLLGIDITGKDSLQVIEDVREAIKGLDNATATNLIQQIGLDPGFINVLRLSRKEFEAMTQKGFLSKDQRDGITKMGTQFQKLKIQLVNLKDNIVALLAPAFGRVFEMVTKITSSLIDFVNWIGESKVIMASLGAVAAILFAAFAPLSTILIGVALAIEDIITYFQGGDSFTGDLLKDLEEIGKAIDKWLLQPLEKVSGFFEMFTAGGIAKYLVGTFGGGSGGAQTTNQNANINNTYNISSSADSKQLANDIVGGQQRMLNHALSDINNGALN